MKTCSKCNTPKELTEFHKDKKALDGYSYVCKICVKERRKNHYNNNKEKHFLYTTEYRKQNKDKINEQANLRAKSEKYVLKRQKYYELNKDLINEKRRSRRQKNKNKENEKVRNYRTKNKQVINKKRNNQIKLRKEKDELFKLSLTLRRLLNQSFKIKGLNKTNKTEILLGCSIAEFKQYLESKFESWMNWENYGKYKINTLNYGWDIDHIIPLKKAKTKEDIIKLCHHTNLQPLCSYVNRHIKKGD